MLEAKNLNISYGHVQVVWDLSFRVDSGELVAILGANGAGKTTTLKALAGLIKAQSGSILFEGEELNGCDVAEIVARGMSLVPEGRLVFPNMTVEENLDLGAYIDRARGQRTRTLQKVTELFPILRDRRNQKAGTLSGGEQQMLAIARSLMSGPRMILLDEPSLGLAPKIAQSIFATIGAMREESGITTLLVEQDVKKALSIADRAYVIENGRIVKEGRTAELAQDPAIRKAYLGM